MDVKSNEQRKCADCRLAWTSVVHGFVFCPVLNMNVYAGSVMCKIGEDARESF